MQRCAAGALSGTRVLLHELATATEGWALERGGWAVTAAPAANKVMRDPSGAACGVSSRGEGSTIRRREAVVKKMQGAP